MICTHFRLVSLGTHVNIKVPKDTLTFPQLYTETEFNKYSCTHPHIDTFTDLCRSKHAQRKEIDSNKFILKSKDR